MLAGIEQSFAKFAKRPQRFRRINGLAYCSHEVLRAAQEIQSTEVQGGEPIKSQSETESPFEREDLLKYFSRNQAALEAAARKAQGAGQDVMAGDLKDIARSLAAIGEAQNAAGAADFEGLERQLTALEEKVSAVLMRGAPAGQLVQFREEVDRGLRIDRRKMTAAQIESLERQYLKKRLFEQFAVPRLSLFYL